MNDLFLFDVLCDGGSTLETLDLALCIVSTPTFLYGVIFSTMTSFSLIWAIERRRGLHSKICFAYFYTGLTSLEK